MKRIYHGLVSPILILIIATIPFSGMADSSILSPQENLWLKSRNNTIIVYPEKNHPPYSYQNSSGIPQGLSIDYIELIGQKIGAKIEYLPARPLSQILDDVKQGDKGDVITSLADTKEREELLYFSDTYVNVPAVIVVRKDSDIGNALTLSSLSGKRVAIGSKYAVEEFVRVTNPRVIIESVIDDESGLQQVVLGEVDAAIMDVASLSYYLSKQVLNSVKIVGSTGFEYKLAFAVPKSKEILQSILDKGLQQVSESDRNALNDKWINISNYDGGTAQSIFSDISKNTSTIVMYILLLLFIVVIILFLKRNHYSGYIPMRYTRKVSDIDDLKEEIAELEHTSESLIEELKDVKNLEQDIKEKIHNIEK